MGNSPLSYCDAPGHLGNGADPLMQAIMVCGDHDVNMDRTLEAIFHEHELDMDTVNRGISRHRRPVPEEPRAQRLEALIRQLFNLQDLNADGLIQESELRHSIASLRQGQAVNSALSMRTAGRALFLNRLDAYGRPVPYPTFRKYVLQILQELDPDEAAQEIILDQFVAEANMSRGVGVFRYKCQKHIAQAPYMPVAPRRISFMPVAPCRMGVSLSRDPRVQQMVTL